LSERKLGGKKGDAREPDEEGFWKFWAAAIKRGRGFRMDGMRWDEMKGG